jgi:predicted dehydrogenase
MTIRKPHEGILRVGVIGAGGIAQMMHLPTLTERPDLFELVALADVNRTTLDAAAERYAIPNAARHEDWRQLVKRDDVDAVLIASSGSHKDAAVAALDARKHLFVEKPLGHCRRELDEIGRAHAGAKAHGKECVLMVGYHKRYDPAYRRAREIVRTMSDLRYVEVTVLHPDDGAYRTHHAVLPTRPPEPADEAASERRTAEEVTRGPMAPLLAELFGASEGAALVATRVAALIATTSLVHDINLVRGVLGEPEGVVSSHVWRGGMAQSSVTRFGGDTRVNMSWVSVPPLKNYTETVRFVAPDKRVMLVFPSPYLRHQPTSLSVERMDGEELVIERHVVNYEEAFREELYAFREHVLSGSAPETGLSDSLGDLGWIEALVRAMRP